MAFLVHSIPPTSLPSLFQITVMLITIFWNDVIFKFYNSNNSIICITSGNHATILLMKKIEYFQQIKFSFTSYSQFMKCYCTFWSFFSEWGFGLYLHKIYKRCMLPKLQPISQNISRIPIQYFQNKGLPCHQYVSVWEIARCFNNFI